jgi:hypothetical protein
VTQRRLIFLCNLSDVFVSIVIIPSVHICDNKINLFYEKIFLFLFPRFVWTFIRGRNGSFICIFILFIMREDKCSMALTVWGWNWYFKDEKSFLFGRPTYLPDCSIVTRATISSGPCYRPNRKQQGSSKAQAIVHPNGFDFQLLPLGCASLLLAGATGGTFMKHKFISPPQQFMDVIITIII